VPQTGFQPRFSRAPEYYLYGPRIANLLRNTCYRRGSMTHLIVCREYPPAPYPPGGIGTYVRHISRLLAEAGETVHVIAQRWAGAPDAVSKLLGGKLVVHRVGVDQAIPGTSSQTAWETRLLNGLAVSDCPSQAFAWQAARVAESLVETEGIDVIEAQEFEAPLYYFQVRRALGLGPTRQPPCLIHLHSPTELIFQHNGWDRTLADFLPLTRFEQYSVHAADALVCPSRYLARGAEDLFGLESNRIQVVPYPLGDTPILERTGDIWSNNSICFTGRLELRKGILEWVEAAVRVASTHASATFDFVGSDTSLSGSKGSVRECLDAMIPRTLKRRFRFHGTQPRPQLLRILAQASIAVVPSVWENFPYSCLEAMATGLPVLVSPKGGMTELINDGECGWVAADATADALASTLRRVLSTPWEKRAAMGREAAQAVRRICDHRTVIGHHLKMRMEMAASGVLRSRSIPGGSATPLLRVNSNHEPRGMGLILTCFDDPQQLPGCLKAIEAQTRGARTKVLVVHERFRDTQELTRLAGDDAWCIVYAPSSSPALARNSGVQAISKEAQELTGVGFLDEYVRLEPHFLEACESAFACQPGLGVLSSWREYSDELSAQPAPLLFKDALNEEFLRCAAVRTEALPEILQSSDEGTAAGWTCLTYPDALNSVTPAGRRQIARQKRYSVMAQAQHESARPLERFLSASLADKVNLIGRGIKQPRRTAQWVAWQMRSIGGKALDSQ